MLFIRLSLLLHDDDQVLLTLLLELCHFLLGLLELDRHLLDLLARLVDLEQAVLQLRRRAAKLVLLLTEQSDNT